MTGQQLSLFDAARARPSPRKAEKDPPLSPLDIEWGDKVAAWFRMTEDGGLRPWLVSSRGADFLPPEDSISDEVFALVCQVLELGRRSWNESNRSSPRGRIRAAGQYRKTR